MMTESTVEAGRLASSQADLAGKVSRVALAVPAIALLLGAALAALEPQLGLLATALILGWTQLVGL
jgi:hypothetical protein